MALFLVFTWLTAGCAAQPLAATPGADNSPTPPATGGSTALPETGGGISGPTVSVSGPASEGQLPSGTPSSQPQPTLASPEAVTRENNGQTVLLKVGQSFVLNLGEGYEWTVETSDPAVLSRKVNITVIRGAQGVYEALQPGSAVLTANGEPLCRSQQPPCEAPSIMFQIQVVVQ